MTENGRSTSQTRLTLLGRVHDLNDQAAWNEFVGLYAPKIFSWCRQFRLQDSDAADVTQQVLYKLVQVMREFRYDAARGTFRSWLKTVTANTVRDLVREWNKPGRARGDDRSEQTLLAIESPDAIEALTRSLEMTHEQEILRVAEQAVQLRVKPQTWEAYRLTALDQIPPPEVARRVGLPVSEVYVAKSRVLKMLREEVRKLDPGTES